MIWSPKQDLGPGEARTRQRQRRYLAYLGLGGVLGGVIGFLAGYLDKGDANLFAGDWDALALDPGLALFLAALLLIGFLAVPLWGFRIVDELKREHSLVGYTGSSLAVLAAFPVWAVLHAGGFVPPPHAFGIFAIAYVSMAASFLFARWRL
jgi:hypothetical protein